MSARGAAASARNMIVRRPLWQRRVGVAPAEPGNTWTPGRDDRLLGWVCFPHAGIIQQWPRPLQEALTLTDDPFRITDHHFALNHNVLNPGCDLIRIGY